MVYIDKYDFRAILDHLLFTEKRTYINKECKLLTGFSALPYPLINKHPPIYLLAKIELYKEFQAEFAALKFNCME